MSALAGHTFSYPLVPALLPVCFQLPSLGLSSLVFSSFPRSSVLAQTPLSFSPANHIHLSVLRSPQRRPPPSLACLRILLRSRSLSFRLQRLWITLPSLSCALPLLTPDFYSLLRPEPPSATDLHPIPKAEESWVTKMHQRQTPCPLCSGCRGTACH